MSAKKKETMSKSTKMPQHESLGKCLESMRHHTLVNGKPLSIDTLCRLAPMSQHTYMSLKRASTAI